MQTKSESLPLPESFLAPYDTKDIGIFKSGSKLLHFPLIFNSTWMQTTFIKREQISENTFSFYLE